jgi:AcrR family transcriptional regulator
LSSTRRPSERRREDSRPRRPHHDLSRDEHKALTRQALLRAALRLLSKNSFDSISLREVTREAGLSPTAFYRHFDDMEELGLELVSEAFSTLRDMLRSARSDPSLVEDVINRSVEVLSDHLEAHEAHIRFIARERHGGVRRIRAAIAKELAEVTGELAGDFAVFPLINKWPDEDRFLLANLFVEFMTGVAGAMVDAEPAARAGIAERSQRQLRLIVVGVTGWKP